MAKGMKDLERDSIDFGKSKIGPLFRSIFFPTLLSLAIQDTTITAAAHKLDLATEEPKTGNDFGEM